MIASFWRNQILNSSVSKLVWSALICAAPSGLAESFCMDFRWKPTAANLVNFDFSILDIQSAPDLGPGHAAGKKFFSYLSIGQIAGDAPYLADVQARGVRMLHQNAEWNSYYPDLADPRWALYVINVLAPMIVNKGFDGFFLDTVDAVETMMEIDPANASAHKAGMINLIRGLKAAYPTKEILTNRGFVVFDDVKSVLKGMVVEELFQRDDYSARSQDGIDQLLARIAPVTAAGLPVYIVDYAPPDNLPLAEQTAQRIAELGFHPLVVPQQINGTVLAPAHPAIIAPPANVTASAGAAVALTSTVIGMPPLSYQWQLNGVNVPGATAKSLSLQNVEPGNAGQYRIVVSNSYGSATSSPAVVTVAGGAVSGPVKVQVRRVNDQTITLSFTAQASRSYTVQSCDSLRDDVWTRVQDLDPQLVDGQVELFQPAAQSSAVRFFRVVSPKAE
jgi:hypothetical protein